MKNTAILRGLGTLAILFATSALAKMPMMDRESSRTEAKKSNERGDYDPVAKQLEEELLRAETTGKTNGCALGMDLGQLRYLQERYTEAETLYRRALWNTQHSPACGHLEPYILNDLALVCKERGQYDEAETLLKRALAIDHSENYGLIHSNNLARVYGAQGKTSEAAQIYRQLLSTLKKPAWKHSQAVEIVEENLENLLRDGQNRK